MPTFLATATYRPMFLATATPFRYKATRSKGGSTRTALQALAAAYRYLANHTSTGGHGILRVQSGDWNDGFSSIARCRHVFPIHTAPH